MQNHYNKYGDCDFQFSILLCCDKENLLKTEQYFIDSYKPKFNICPNANSRLGQKLTEKSKQNISNAKKGKYLGSNNPFFGKKHTKESKDKIKENHKINNIGFKKGYIPWNKGMKLSEELRIKIAAKNPMRVSIILKKPKIK